MDDGFTCNNSALRIFDINILASGSLHIGNGETVSFARYSMVFDTVSVDEVKDLFYSVESVRVRIDFISLGISNWRQSRQR